MRFLAASFCACLIFTVPLGGQTAGDDPYSITFVRNNLQIVTTNPSWTSNQLCRERPSKTW